MLNSQSGPDSFDPGPMLLALKALKDGDFSARLPEGPTAIGRQLAKAFNEVAELNASLAREVENVRVAVKNNQETRRRAKIRGAKGSWSKSVDFINELADLAAQSSEPKKDVETGSKDLPPKELLRTVAALKKGDFSVRLPNDWTGISGKIADTLNDVIERNDNLTKELERVSRVVGKEGRIAQRAT